MKKLIPLCLSVLLLVGLTACSGSSEEDRATQRPAAARALRRKVLALVKATQR